LASVWYCWFTLKERRRSPEEGEREKKTEGRGENEGKRGENEGNTRGTRGEHERKGERDLLWGGKNRKRKYKVKIKNKSEFQI